MICMHIPPFELKIHFKKEYLLFLRHHLVILNRLQTFFEDLVHLQLYYASKNVTSQLEFSYKNKSLKVNYGINHLKEYAFNDA